MRRLIAFVVAAMVAIPLTGIASAQSPDYLYGQEQRRIYDSAAGETLYKIDDGLIITQRDLAERKAEKAYLKEKDLAYLSANEDSTESEKSALRARVLEDDEVLDELIAELVQLAQAKELGLTATEADASKALADNERRFKEAASEAAEDETAAKSVDTVTREINDFRAGFGMTDEEYRVKVELPILKRILIIDAVKRQYNEEIDPNDELSSEEFELEYSRYVAQLRQKFPSVE